MRLIIIYLIVLSCELVISHWWRVFSSKFFFNIIFIFRQFVIVLDQLAELDEIVIKNQEIQSEEISQCKYFDSK